MKKVRTLRDAVIQNRVAKETRLMAITRRELRKKIRHWERMVIKFGGQTQRETLAKFQDQLAAIS